MDHWIGKVAVVTDASVAIGATIAEALVKEGILVIGLAKRLDKLAKLSASLKEAKGTLHSRQCDLSKGENLLDAFKWIKAEFGGVDILVNNASVNSRNGILDDDDDDDPNSLQNMFSVPVFATATSIRESVASMRSRNVAGRIIVINSVDQIDVPRHSIGRSRSLCSPNEFSVTGLTEGTRQELADAGSNIKVTHVSAGLLKMDITRAAGGYCRERRFDHLSLVQAKNIAESVVYSLSTPDYMHLTEVSIQHRGERI